VKQYKVIVYTLVANYDLDLMERFLAHYRAMGVSGFKLALHGFWGRSERDGLAEQPDVEVVELVAGRFSEALKLGVLDRMVSGAVGEWGIFVDADEFLELPYGRLSRCIDAMQVLGMNALPGFLMQRTSADGTLASLDSERPIGDQFPLMNPQLCELMGLKNPAWKDKYPIALITPSFTSKSGNHLPPNDEVCSHAPLRAVVHHYKWRSALNHAFSQKRGKNSNAHEMDLYQAYLEENGGKLPVEHARWCERGTLFELGFLAKPDRKALALHGFLRRLRAGEVDARPQTQETLRTVLGTWAHTKEQKELLDSVNLAKPKGKVCLVGFEIAGPTLTGGIGTAIAALAELLSGHGHEVHVLFCPFNDKQGLGEHWQRFWGAYGVTIHYLPRSVVSGFGPASFFSFCQIMTDRLEALECDVIHFHDSVGYGGFASLKKASGLAFQSTQILVTEHGSTRWHRRGNLLPWNDIEPEYELLHKATLELSNMSLFPSRYMLEWSSQGAKLPRGFVLPNVLRSNARFYGQPQSDTAQPNGIAYFGRIEERKGIYEFLAALERLQSRLPPETRVCLLGKFGEVDREAIVRRLKRLNFKTEVIENFGSADAINFLKFGQFLTVIPSKVENLPYTVYEALENGISVISSGVGGIPELFKSAADISIGAVKAKDLTESIEAAIRNPAKTPELAFDPSVVEVAHLALYGAMVEQAGQTVESLHSAEATTMWIAYGEGDGSSAPMDGSSADGEETSGQNTWAPEGCTWHQVTDQPQQHPWSVEVNKLVAEQKGGRIIFRHLSAKPSRNAYQALDRLMTRSGADAAVCGFSAHVYDGDVPVSKLNVLALGGPGIRSICQNVFGAGFFLVSADAFNAVGGFDASIPDDATAHWELLNRLLASGKNVVASPEPLVEIPRTSLEEAQRPIHPRMQDRLIGAWIEDSSQTVNDLVRTAVERMRQEHRLLGTDSVINVEETENPKTSKAAQQHGSASNAPRYISSTALDAMIKSMPPQLRNSHAILSAASNNMPWYKIAVRHPLKVKYWNTVRRMQRKSK